MAEASGNCSLGAASATANASPLRSLGSQGAQSIMIPSPVFLLGVYDPQDQPLLALPQGVAQCSDSPVCVVCSLPAGLALEAVLSRRAFTLNMPFACQVAQADYLRLRHAYGKDIGNEVFALLGLQCQGAEHVDAPLLPQCSLVLELSLVQENSLGSHHLLVGELLDAKMAMSVAPTLGCPHVNALQPLLYLPVACEYFHLGDLIARAFSVGKTIAVHNL